MGFGSGRSSARHEKRPNKERRRLRDWLRYFFNILILVAFWHWYADAIGSYSHAVLARLVTRIPGEGLQKILASGEWQDVLDIPPVWRNAPGWLYVVAAVALGVLGALLLIGYLKASRKLSDMFWDTLEARVQRVVRTELHRFWRIVQRRLRFRYPFGSEVISPFEDMLSAEENASDDRRLPEIEVGVIEHRDASNGFWWDIKLWMRIPMRREIPQHVVESAIPPEIPEVLDDPDRPD